MPEPSRDASWPAAFWAVLLLAAALRLGYVLFYPQMPMCPDCQAYDEVGRHLADGRGFVGGFGGDTLFWPQVHQPDAPEIGIGPVYPAFLAAIYRVFGHQFRWVRVAQALIASLALVPLFSLVDRVLGRPAALGTCGLVALYPAFIVYSGFVLTESLSTAMLIATMWTLHRAWTRGTPAWWTFAGAMMALAALLRAEFVVVLGAAVMLTLWRQPTRRTVMALVLVAAAAAVTMAPWTIRNYRLFHRFILVSAHDGDTLWISVKGWREWRFGDPELQNLVRGLSYLEESDALKTAALREIADRPLSFAWTRLKRFPDLWLTGHTGNVAGVTDSFEAYWRRGEYGIVGIKGALLALNVGLIGLGLIGGFRAVTSATLSRPDVLLLATPIVCISIVHFVLFAAPRYQIPMMPFVLAFAAWMGRRTAEGAR
ncbi:MAG: glycosyltransferase family 39 protein [Acidobacteria bacterium]|nr:glycosyltransferase family 39 protein [Acidobacteriota bacterium]